MKYDSRDPSLPGGYYGSPEHALQRLRALLSHPDDQVKSVAAIAIGALQGQRRESYAMLRERYTRLVGRMAKLREDWTAERAERLREELARSAAARRRG